DGIRDKLVTGVQTCALPISRERRIEALVLLVLYLAMPVAVRAAAVTSRAWGWLCPYFMSGGGRSIHDPVAATGGLGYGIFTPKAPRAPHAIAQTAGMHCQRSTLRHWACIRGKPNT